MAVKQNRSSSIHPYKKIKHRDFIFGKYRIKWKRPPKSLQPKRGKLIGLCDPFTQKNKRIYIEPDKNRLRFLTTIIHEALHASNFLMSEEGVEIASEDIAKLVWDAGFYYIPDVKEDLEKIKKKVEKVA